MNYNIRKLVIYITTKEQFNGGIPTLDDLYIMSLSGYEDTWLDPMECYIIDLSTFKKLTSYILHEQKHNTVDEYYVIPLDDKILKYIYKTLSNLTADGGLDRKLKHQLNVLKDCIITKEENEVICAFMY